MPTAIAEADRTQPLLLDQDPAAIVMVYSKMFKDQGLMNDAQYSSLVEYLIEVERMLQAWRIPRICIYLKADECVLRQRVLNREGNLAMPSLNWFLTAKAYFDALMQRLPKVIHIPAARLSAREIAERIRLAIDN